MQKTAVKGFLWNLCRFWLILVLVKNMGRWVDSATLAIDGLKATFAGGDPWNWVDELWEKVQQGAAYLMCKDTSTYVKTNGVIASLLKYAGGRIGLWLTLIVYLVAEFTINILTIYSPLFII
ncbi:type IV secretion system protein [Enterobacter cloacae]|uniref:type IV secretion system protein n=1 Tax=Enterobacter cloacae TaxID=550 RepID=UPI001F5053ED|nr:type IV secretion system protein [Enterobacter cloacae]